VRVAARLAREESARLVLLHVEKPRSGEGLLAPPPARIAFARQQETERWSGLATAVRGEPVPLELADGDPADGIVAFAVKTGCDLIVLGSRGRSRASLALASVTGKVLAHAPCAVIVVPAGLEDVRADFPDQVA